MYIIYIGQKTEWVEQLKTLLNQKMTVVDTPFKARSYIFENFYTSKQPVFVFIESTEIDQDLKWIEQLKKNRIKNQYLILISENIQKDLLPQYISSGINDVIDISIRKESLHQLLKILPRLKKQTEEENELSQIFKLPVWKRCFDVAFTTGALICLSPLFLITALAIRLESKGSIIYTSQRVGTNYKIFGFLKFRSMYTDADKRLDEFKKLNQYQSTSKIKPQKYYSDPNGSSDTIFVGDDFHLTEGEYINRRKKIKENNYIKLQNDPRITIVGHIIRKYSIDELPQLFNILKGDMSIVGNRPLPLYEAEMLTSDDYIERFMAPAGLTGLWQVEKRGTEGILSAEERKQLDIQYARKFSFKMDMRIILRTFTAFIQKENV